MKNQIRNYKKLVAEGYRYSVHRSLRKRVGILVNQFSGDIFLNNTHRKEFYDFCKEKKIDMGDENISTGYLAVVFLLTSQEQWSMVREEMVGQGFIFKNIKMKAMATDNYAVYKMAQSIQIRGNGITEEELGDMELIGDGAFKIIINATLIEMYGWKVLGFHKVNKCKNRGA